MALVYSYDCGLRSIRTSSSLGRWQSLPTQWLSSCNKLQVPGPARRGIMLSGLLPVSTTNPMHEELWSGPQLKLEYALFHLTRIQRALQRPEMTGDCAANITSNGIVDTGWQPSLYPHFDAFLAAARSIPEIIQCCFGTDRDYRLLRWFQQLPAEEQARRRAFRHQFTGYKTFRDLPLSRTRQTSLHRRGHADAMLIISGRFGVTYIGGPAKPIPGCETVDTDNPQPPLMTKASAIMPHYQDFQIDRRPLVTECHEYLWQAQKLIDDARALAEEVHGRSMLSAPPDA